MMYCSAVILVFLGAMLSGAVNASTLLGFQQSPWFGEQVREETTPDGIRMLFNMPEEMRADRPTLLIFYSTPNGNSIEQTMGCAMVLDLDWHYDIQHIAAQTRRLRELDKERNIVLVCMEAEGRSWPAWRQKHKDNARIIREMIEAAMKGIPGREISVCIAGHSGGGSMIWGFLNAHEAIPPWVERIAFLDANYSYSDKEKHGDKLLQWLKDNGRAHLVVLAYDDRRIELDGKPVVGPTGGTLRASHRMISRFEKDLPVKHVLYDLFDLYVLSEGRISIYIHRNPQNKILHTALIGEMNGFLEAVTLGTKLEGKWGKFGGPRAYTKWIQPAEVSRQVIPPRPMKARAGEAIMRDIASMTLVEREKVLEDDLMKGNIPPFLRDFKPIHVKGKDANGKEHVLVFYAMPDYLSVGSDKDFCRIPITPILAQKIADAVSCTLPTRMMVDQIHEKADVKLEPRPLTEKREDVLTFLQHNSIIEGQRKGKALGLLVSGIKKDVVITDLLQARPDHVAIYGWHKLDDSPIQPLTTVHVNWYVDYSHGVRLIRRTILVDGNPKDIRDVLNDPVLHTLLSDEGPIPNRFYSGELHPPTRQITPARLLDNHLASCYLYT